MTPFGWGSIARLGLVQMALGAIVVLTTSTLNRVMVVELALPALLPGLLVALHYLVQIARPRMGHGSDVGGRRTPWIVGGMAVLAFGQTPQGEGLPAAARYAAVLGFSAIGGLIPATLFSLAVRVAPGEGAVSTTVGWVQQWSSAGQFVGPPLVAWVAAQAGGWQLTWAVTGSAALLGALLGLRLRRVRA